MRSFIRSHLTGAYEVVEAQNGRVGVDLATELVPDLIVSDVMMPEMDGLEATSRLKQDDRTSHIPIVLLTARSEVEDRIEGYESGADAYFPKPFSAAELQVCIRTLIEERRRLRRIWSVGEAPPAADALPPREAAFLEKVRLEIGEWISDSQFSVERLAESMQHPFIHTRL